MRDAEGEGGQGQKGAESSGRVHACYGLEDLLVDKLVGGLSEGMTE